MNAPEKLLPLGLIEGMDAGVYHADPGVSNSGISEAHKSLRHYWAKHVDPQRAVRDEPTAAMRGGTLLHTLVLEPDTVPSRYVVRPAGLDGRTKEGKAWLESAGDRTVLTADEWSVAQRQRDALLAVPEIAHALDRQQGVAESSVFWTDPATGLRCRARPDYLRRLGPSSVLLVDLKTTADASPAEFAKSAARYGYHRQQAHYTTGVEIGGGLDVAGFLFAVVTSSAPFIAVPYVLDPSAVDLGAVQRARLLQRIADCRQSGEWPAYGTGVQSLTLPGWAFTE